MDNDLKERLEGSLACNPAWTTGCPGLPGLDYMACLEKWKVNKLVILRTMLKDLEELEAEDNEKATLVKSMVVREIATAKWQAKCGTFPIWRGIFSRALSVAKKNLTGRTDLEELSKGILKNAKENKPGAVAKQFGIQGSTSRPGSRTSGPGCHDALEGRR